MKKEKEIYHALLDPDYQDAYIDIDEVRTRKHAEGKETAYRYIHGGFKKKAVKFSIHFPQANQFKGRFFHYLSPFPGADEELTSIPKKGADDVILFSLLHGAYFVESNMGAPASDNVTLWKSSAAVAEFGRKKAMEIYSCSRPVGIVFGGSGGGYKTMACIENTDTWEGAVPYVIGSPVSLPNTITMHVQGERVLRHVFPKIMDNLDAGGSGDMYQGLNSEEKQMLREMTDMGFPPMAWYPEANGQFSDQSLPLLTPMVKMADPGYFTDFWTVPGYQGSDPNSNASKDRICFRGTVKKVHLAGKSESINRIVIIESRNGVDDAWKKAFKDGKDAWIEMETLPEGKDLYLRGVDITFETGEAKGKQLPLGEMYHDEHTSGGFLSIGMCNGTDDVDEILSRVRPGDELTMDNSDYIAMQSYYRHQVPEDLSFHAWDQFRRGDGSPELPQRSNVVGYSFSGTGTVQDGNIQSKVIVIQALMDESTCPWCADWYRSKIIETKGNEDDFRLYYMQRCMHGDLACLGDNMRTNYKGALLQALLDMADWLQLGKEPLRTTVYTKKGSQIVEEPKADKRCGMQAGVLLTVNGQKCAQVKAGEEFVLKAEMTLPENAGEITSVYFDFNDNWSHSDLLEDVFPIEGKYTRTISNGIHGAISEIKHYFEEKGTYFASVRIASQRNGDEKDIFTQISNLDRVRIVVE